MSYYKCPKHGIPEIIKAFVPHTIIMRLSTSSEFMGKYHYDWGYIKAENLVCPLCGECGSRLELVTDNCQHELTKNIMGSYYSDENCDLTVTKICTLCGIAVGEFCLGADDVCDYIMKNGTIS